MSVELAPNVREIVERLVASGAFESESAVVEHAIESLDRRIEELDGLRASIDDMRAGRTRPHDQVMADIEATYPFLGDRA